jgi:outer membrane protein TolC
MARLDVARAQVATAEEDYLLALRRYNAQMGTNLDVLDARVALTESRTAYVNAIYDIASAQAGLIYALGEDALPEDW